MLSASAPLPEAIEATLPAGAMKTERPLVLQYPSLNRSAGVAHSYENVYFF